MSVNYRVVLRFSFQNPLICGFSERYDFNDGGGGNSFAQSVAQRIAQARRVVMSSSWRITRVTLGTILPKLSAKTGKYFNAFTMIQLCPDITGGAGFLGVADNPTSAIYVQQKFVGRSRTVARQMRAIPDTWWENATLQNSAGALNIFFTYLQSIPQIEVVTNKTTGSSSNANLLCSTLQRISSRRTGRPFLPLRGRRSKRAVLPA